MLYAHKFLFLVIGILSLATNATAQNSDQSHLPPSGISALTTNSELQNLFDRGEYQALIDRANTDPSTENLVMAARAANTIAYFSESNKTAKRASKQAYGFATMAIEKDSNNAEAFVQAAIGDAVYAARISPVRAFVRGYAKRSRRNLDRALALDPDNPWALSTSGAWHLEVKRAGGARLYGASEQTGFDQFQKARALLPNEISIAYEMALRVLAFKNPEWREDALAALDVAMKAETVSSSFETEIQNRADAFSAEIEKGPAAERAFIKAQH